MVVFGEVAVGAEVELLIGGEKPEDIVAFKQAVELASASDANTVAEDQHHRQQRR